MSRLIGSSTRSLRFMVATVVAGAALLGGAGAVAAQGNGNGNANGSAAGAHGNGNSNGNGNANGHGNANGSRTTASHGSSSHTGSGDRNAGDVWTDNVNLPAGPGREQDPHLSCTNINLWAAGLADASGTYAIDGWQPSGSQETDYSSTWAYNAATGGTQVISVIDVQTLIANAIANGDTPNSQQGYHFKLQLSQDPQKHKTFWVDCSAPSTSGGGGGNGGGGNGGGGGGNGGGGTTGGGNIGGTGAGGIQGVSTSTGTGTAGIGGVLGVSASTPLTGTPLAAGLALLLISAGSGLVLLSRRRGGRTAA